MTGGDDSESSDSVLRAVARSPDVPLLEGRRVAQFRVLRKIASGGMGTVYEAEDENLARRIALKVLARSTDPALHPRFLREARMASRINHPNVATIFDAGETGDIAYIAMELVEGETLRCWSHGSRTLRERLTVVRQIAAALA